MICKKNLQTEGIFSIKAAPLGGKLVLLTKVGDEDISFAFIGATVPLSTWFEETCPRDLGLLPNDRTVWINITWVLTHAFKEDSFKTIAQIVGSFRKMDDKTKDRSRLDVARILITSKYPEVINMSYKVKILDTVFTNIMMEDSPYYPYREKDSPSVNRSMEDDSSGVSGSGDCNVSGCFTD